MGDAATLAALQRVCDDAAQSVPDAYPALLAVCSSALLGADESYVSATEMARAYRRLAPALAGGAAQEAVAARLESCRAAFDALDEDDPRKAELLRAPYQQKAVDRFAAGTTPCIVETSLPRLPRADATAQALRRRRAKIARAEREARGQGPAAVRARRQRHALLLGGCAALAVLLLVAALRWSAQKR